MVIRDLRRYLELDDKARSAEGISVDEVIERSVYRRVFEEINLLKVLLSEVERLRGLLGEKDKV